MKLKNEEGKPLMDLEVIDNIITLLVGGYFSTSLAMMWALYYLAEYPDVLQKLRVRTTNKHQKIPHKEKPKNPNS